MWCFGGMEDPGRCPVDDAPHTTCTSADYAAGSPIVIAQMPARDAAVAAARPLLRAEALQATLPPGQFTTGTYRGARRRRQER
jgi:hypothetical protein